MKDKRLKYNEVKDYRLETRREQGGICPLCRGHIKANASALDHDHDTGRVRAVLHPECNILLGKIENFVNRWSRGLSGKRLYNFLDNAHAYMVASYTGNPFHPKHRTVAEKEVRRLTKILKRSKRPETKAKYRKLIEEAKDG